MNKTVSHIETFENELLWLEQLFILRMEDSTMDICAIKGTYDSILSDKENPVVSFPPELNPKASKYANLVITNKLTLEERILLILALVPNLKPDLLGNIFDTKRLDGTPFFKINELGGVRGINFRGIMPTGFTFLYLVAGINLEKRLKLLSLLLKKNSALFEKEIILLEAPKTGDPVGAETILVHPAYLKVLITNELPQ